MNENLAKMVERITKRDELITEQSECFTKIDERITENISANFKSISFFKSIILLIKISNSSFFFLHQISQLNLLLLSFQTYLSVNILFQRFFFFFLLYFDFLRCLLFLYSLSLFPNK